MLPVYVGIVGEGHCEGSAWRAALQNKIGEIFIEHQKQFTSTPIFLLCNQRNDLEKLAFEVSLPFAAGSMPFTDTTDESIAKNSHILFCIHPENDKSLDHVMEVRLKKGGVDLRGLLYKQERGPVYEFRMNPGTVAVRLSYPGHGSEKDPAARFKEIWKNIDAFNKDAKKKKMQDPATSILPEAAIKELSLSDQDLLKEYEVCDRLSVHYQKRTLVIYMLLFLLSFAFVFFYDIYAILFPRDIHRVPYYLASITIAVLIYQFGKATNYENKYLDYRALTEGLRVQFFWNLAGLNLAVSDHYLHKSENELTWIRSALRSWYIQAQKMKTKALLSKEQRFDAVFRYWIQNQKDYFSNRGKKNKNELQSLKIGSSLMLGIAYILTVFKILVSQPTLPSQAITSMISRIGNDPTWLLVMTSAVAAVGALVKGLIKNRGLSEHLKQYSRMAELYSFALECAHTLKKEEDKDLLIEELGKEALAENAEWVLLHRERRITFPGPK